MTAAALLLLASLAAEPPASGTPPPLSGGFGRARPTAAPSPTPAPRPAATRPPAAPGPGATPAAPPAPAKTAGPNPPAAPSRPVPPPASPRPAPRSAPAAPEEPARRQAVVSVGYVMVPFVVTDPRGRSVGDLRRQDVSLLADGVPVAFDLFERSQDAPVSFAILLDISGSMGLVGKMDRAREAVDALLAARRPGDDFSLHVFARGEVREVVPFTTSAREVSRAVRAAEPWGRTAFFDALAKMPDRSLLGRNGSRAIVLLTDGIDNASVLSRGDLSALLEGVDVPVYPLVLRSPGTPLTPPAGQNPETLLDLDVLGHVARLSGGRLTVATSAQELLTAVQGLLVDLRSQYLVGFAPTGRGPVRYRRLALRLAGPVRPVRVRAGYRGTDPPTTDGTGSGGVPPGRQSNKRGKE